jgi:alcohol dehydrogenase
LNGHVQPGDQVAIVGAGPIGLASLMTAQFFSPADIFVVDTDDYRLQTAKNMGATAVFNSQKENAGERILQLTEGQGVQAAIEAVGIPETFDLCQKVIASGGSIANVGVHGKSVELHLEDLWSKNITIKTRLVDTETTPLLMKSVKSGMLEPSHLITHHFNFQEAMKAYDTFESSGKKHALKVIMINK